MRITKLSLISALALVISSAIASQTIDFSNKNIARYTLLDKTWACNMVDSLGKGQGYWTFNSVNGVRVKGKIEIPQYIACSSDTLKGTLKGNTLKYTSRSNHSSCVSINGVFNFFHDEKGELKAKSNYTYGGTRRRGTYSCEQLNLAL